MSKNTISTFTLILLIGTVMWFFQMNHEAERAAARELDAAATAEVAADEPIAVVSRPTPQRSPAQNRSVSPRASEVSGELQTLQQQLASAQEVLQVQRASYQELNSQSRAFVARAPAADDRNALGVLRSESDVQNNLMQMDSYKTLEQQITQQAEEQIRTQNSAVQMELSQIDQSIQVQQRRIQQTREDLVFWGQNYNDLTRQAQQLQNLNDQLTAQNQELELMLQQRVLISTGALNNAQAIQLQKQEALADLNSDRQAAQDDVESLRDSIIRLQQSQREIRNTQASMSSQLKQAQSSLQSQEAQVKALESAVEQKKQELDSLVQ